MTDVVDDDIMDDLAYYIARENYADVRRALAAFRDGIIDEVSEMLAEQAKAEPAKDVTEVDMLRVELQTAKRLLMECVRAEPPHFTGPFYRAHEFLKEHM